MDLIGCALNYCNRLFIIAECSDQGNCKCVSKEESLKPFYKHNEDDRFGITLLTKKVRNNALRIKNDPSL